MNLYVIEEVYEFGKHQFDLSYVKTSCINYYWFITKEINNATQGSLTDIPESFIDTLVGRGQ